MKQYFIHTFSQIQKGKQKLDSYLLENGHRQLIHLDGKNSLNLVISCFVSKKVGIREVGWNSSSLEW